MSASPAPGKNGPSKNGRQRTATPAASASVLCASPPDRNKSRRIRTRSRAWAWPSLQYSAPCLMPAFYFRMPRLDEARMNRAGLIVALTIAVVAGVAFGLYPELDLRIARYFYAVEDANH